MIRLRIREFSLDVIKPKPWELALLLVLGVACWAVYGYGVAMIFGCDRTLPRPQNRYVARIDPTDEDLPVGLRGRAPYRRG